MHRHLKTPAPQPLPTPTLSVEEQAILEDEQSEAAITADAAAADADRVTEVADVAQDTILIVDETPEVGQVEQELVSAVGEMAIAGTDGNPEDVISIPPAGEGEDLSVEGIVSSLKSIWHAIVTAIRNMWVGLKHWLTTYFSSLEQNKKHAEALIERLGKMKGYTANDGITLTSTMLNVFDFGGKSSLLALLADPESDDKRFQKYMVSVAQNQHGLMVAIGEGMEKGYREYDGVNATELNSVVDTMSTRMVDYMKKLDLHPGKGGDWVSDGKMGNVKVIAKGYNHQMNDPAQSMETKVALLSKVRFAVDVDTHFTTQTNAFMKADITADKLLEVVKERVTYIDELLKFKGDQFKTLETQAEKVQKACEDMLGRIKDDNKEGTAIAKRMMPLATAYSNWATQPTAKLFNAAARHTKFWLSLYEMTANNFQAPA